MKRGLFILLVLIIIVIPIVYSQEIQTETDEFTGNDDTETINQWADASDIPKVIQTDEGIDITGMSEGYNQVGSISKDTNLITDQGTISLFFMTNALFSLGSLVQGSFISFENNNNIYIKSIFDSSEFTATINKEGSEVNFDEN